MVRSIANPTEEYDLLLDDEPEPELIVTDLEAPPCVAPPPVPAAIPLATPGEGARCIHVGLPDEGSFEFNSIQPALDAAKSGDVIVVHDGVYTGKENRDLEFGRGSTSNGYAANDVTLQSLNGPANCTIDIEGKSGHRAFIFRGNQYSGSTKVIGFTIANGRASSGGGILCIGNPDSRIQEWIGSPTIRNCVIRNCRASKRGGGIYCAKGAAPVLDGCVFHGNGAGSRGGGVGIEGSYLNFSKGINPTLRDVVVMCNIAGAYGGGLWLGEGTRAMVVGGRIAHNESRRDGGGLAFQTSRGLIKKLAKLSRPTDSFGRPVGPNPVLRGLTHGSLAGSEANPIIVEGNVAKRNGGAVWINYGAPFFSFCNVKANRAGMDGGGVCAERSFLEGRPEDWSTPRDIDSPASIAGPPQFYRCRVDGNVAGSAGVGGGIAVKSTSTMYFSHGFVVRNEASRGGGVAVEVKSELFLNNSVVNDNSVSASSAKSPGIGGGVLAEGGVSANFCTIFGNRADGSGAAVYVVEGIGLKNSIVWGNIDPKGRAIDGKQNKSGVVIAPIDARYCNLELWGGVKLGGANAACVMSTSPSFGAPIDGITYVLDYDPARPADFPCVDAGEPCGAPTFCVIPWSEDIAGRPRKVVKKVDAFGQAKAHWCTSLAPRAAVGLDMGAYEVQ